MNSDSIGGQRSEESEVVKGSRRNRAGALSEADRPVPDVSLEGVRVKVRLIAFASALVGLFYTAGAMWKG